MGLVNNNETTILWKGCRRSVAYVISQGGLWRTYGGRTRGYPYAMASGCVGGFGKTVPRDRGTCEIFL